MVRWFVKLIRGMDARLKGCLVMNAILREAISVSELFLLQFVRKFRLDIAQIDLYSAIKQLPEESSVYLSTIREIVTTNGDIKFPWTEFRRMIEDLEKTKNQNQNADEKKTAALVYFLKDTVRAIADEPSLSTILNKKPKIHFEQSQIDGWKPLYLCRMKSDAFSLQLLTGPNGSKRWIATVPSLSIGFERLVYVSAENTLIGSTDKSLAEKGFSVSNLSREQSSSIFFNDVQSGKLPFGYFQNIHEAAAMAWAVAPSIVQLNREFHKLMINEFLNKLTTPNREPCLSNTWRGQFS